MPFGASIGDGIACANVIHTIVQALESSGGSSAVYQELITELEILERALLLIKRLKLDEIPGTQALVKRAIENCQKSISRFLTKNYKFAPHLRSGGSSSSLKDAVRKVQWALCRDEDVAAFRMEINAHVTSINILLSTCHIEIIHNLSQSIGEREQLHASQQSENLEAQKALRSYTHEAITGLRTDVQKLSGTAIPPQRERLVRRRRTRSPAAQQVKSIDTSPGDVEERTADQSKSIRDWTLDHDTPPLETVKISDHLRSLDHETIRHARASKVKLRILDCDWRILGAWLALVAYHEEQYQGPSSTSVLDRIQRQTVIEVNLMCRHFSRQLTFSYGDFTGANRLSMSLSIPNVIWNDDDPIFGFIKSGDLEGIIRLFRTGSYRPTDVNRFGKTLLGHAATYQNAQMYAFLLNEGAKVDAGSISDCSCAFFGYYVGRYSPEIFEIMPGDLWEIEQYLILRDLWEKQLSSEAYPIDMESTLFFINVLNDNGFIEDITSLSRDFLDSMFTPMKTHEEEDLPEVVIKMKESQIILPCLEWFISRGVDPHVRGRFGLDAYALVILVKELPAWLRILCRHRYNPRRAMQIALRTLLESPRFSKFAVGIHSAGDEPGDERKDTLLAAAETYRDESGDALMMKILLDVEEAFREIGLSITLDELLHDIDDEWAPQASGTDFEPGLLTQFQEIDAGNMTVTKRRGRAFTEI